MPEPTFTFTLLVEDADGERRVEHTPTYGTLAEGYAEVCAGRAVSVRSVYTHAPQVPLVRFAMNSEGDPQPSAYDWRGPA